MIRTAPAIAALAALLLNNPLAAQSPDIRERLAGNAQALREYSWTSRSEARIGGREVAVALEKMRYDFDGRLQKTSMGGSGQPTVEQRRLIDAVLRAALAYAQPDPDKAAAFLKRAEMWEGRSSAGEGTLRIEGTGLIQPGDRIDIRAVNQRPDRMDVEATFDGRPLQIRAEYRSLSDDGPAYVARMTVHYPAESMELRVESFDYQRSEALAASDATVEKTLTADAGAEIRIRLSHPLSSKNAVNGQSFEATLDRDLVIDGVTVAERGAKVMGKVVETTGSGRVSGRARMTLTLAELAAGSKTLSLDTHPLAFEAESTKGRDARRIGIATGIGTAIGAIAGGGKGAAIGAGIGAGAGAGTTVMTKGEEVEFAIEQQFLFQLARPLTVTVRQ